MPPVIRHLKGCSCQWWSMWLLENIPPSRSRTAPSPATSANPVTLGFLFVLIFSGVHDPLVVLVQIGNQTLRIALGDVQLLEQVPLSCRKALVYARYAERRRGGVHGFGRVVRRWQFHFNKCYTKTKVA